MTLNIGIETSILYQRGLEKSIRQILLWKLLTDNQIADTFQVSIYRVRKIKSTLPKQLIKQKTLYSEIDTSNLYQRGFEKRFLRAVVKGYKIGVKKQTDKSIHQLLVSKLLTDIQIADTLQVSKYRVRKIKATLPK